MLRTSVTLWLDCFINIVVLLRGNELELVLFDECSGQVYYDQLKTMESPVVVLVNLARIAFDEEGCWYLVVLITVCIGYH